MNALQPRTTSASRPPEFSSTKNENPFLGAFIQHCGRPVGALPGLGAIWTKKLEKMGLKTLKNLLLHLPKRHVYFSKEDPQPNTFFWTVRPTSITNQKNYAVVRGQRVLSHHSDESQVTLFFHKKQIPFLKNLQHRYPLWDVWGTLSAGSTRQDAAHPRLFSESGAFQNPSLALNSVFFPQVGACHPERTCFSVPIYPTSSGVSSQRLAGFIRKALQTFPAASPACPLHIRQTLSAFSALHIPAKPDPAGFDAAKKTMALMYQAHAEIRREKQKKLRLSEEAFFRLNSAKEEENLLMTLDAHLRKYQLCLTESQRNAISDGLQDLAHSYPMRRLLQGDVGSGKTLVALGLIWLMLHTVKHNPSARRPMAVFLAPTLLLAQQVHKVWETLFGKPFRTLLLTRQTPRKKAVITDLKDVEYDLIVGTHALLAESVSVPNLGLLVIDEQHRFGISQRLSLTQNCATTRPKRPHVLLMTATPIPRTHYLSRSKDLDTSYLALRHASQRQTHIMPNTKINDLTEKIANILNNNEKIFWVCPTIDGKNGQAAVKERFHFLQTLFPGKTAALHGAMKAPQQAMVLSAFAAGETPLLVATTVVEIGLDVPDASWMIIEDAQRFGLAQLHQLRGRIGRQGQKSDLICLYSAPLSATGQQRLLSLKSCTDGFDIAQQDLKHRGYGMIFGQKQSGHWEEELGYADKNSAKDLETLVKTAVSETSEVQIFLNALFDPGVPEQNWLRAG